MPEIVEREGYRVKIRGEVPAEEVEGAYRLLLEAYRKRAKVPGFRPGRVPDRVLEARIGREALLAEVREELLDRHLPEAIRELGLDPVAVRRVEGQPVLGEPFVFEAEIENYPEVELPDWRAFTLEATAPAIDDQAVEAALADLQKRYAEVEAVDREAREADQVVVVPEDGSEVVITLAEAYPEVQKALLGRRAGEEVELPLFDQEGKPQGKTARVRIKEVREVRLPPLDDEFAKTLGYESLGEAREKIAEELRRRAEAEVQEARKTELLEKLAEGLKAELPPALVEAEERAIWGEIADDLAKRGIPLEDYLKQLEAEGRLDELKADVRQGAERRVRRGLALEKLTEELGVKLDEDEWRAYLDRMAQRYGLKTGDFERAVGEEGLKRLYVRRLHDKALETALAELAA